MAEYTTFHKLLPEGGYVVSTGQWGTVQKGSAGDNGVAGMMLKYEHRIYKCLRSTQTRIWLERQGGDLEVKRIHCKYELYTDSIQEIIRLLMKKFFPNGIPGKIWIDESRGCSLHGNVDWQIWINDELRYKVPKNY